MADYTKNYNWTSKDGLSSGEAEKVIQGTQFDAEFDDIQTAVNSKFDSSDVNVSNGIAGLDASALVLPAQIPQATTTAVGGGETATDAEADAGAATGANSTKLIAASNLASVLTQAAGTNLTYSAGVLNVDGGLADIGALARTDGNIIVGNGSAWVAESGATARTSLGVAIGSDVQAWDAGLDDISGLAVTNGNIIVGNGSAWVAESGATARTSLGLGTGDSPTFTGATLGSAVLTGPSANRLEVGGRVAFIHDDTTQTSAEIFFSTSAPTTQGSNGDIYFEHEA